jgi:hypothetical protein
VHMLSLNANFSAVIFRSKRYFLDQISNDLADLEVGQLFFAH